MRIPDKTDFPRAREVAYLDTAAEGLPPVGCDEALMRYFRDKGLGTPGRERLYEAETAARCAAARLLGASAEDVALVGNASEALNLLANSIQWRPGDEVLISDLEFPSNVLAWLRLRGQGVEVRIIPSSGGVVTLEQFAELISERTRLVSLSSVSYKTGTRFPFLAALAREVRRVGAIFCVDATQALGRVHVPLTGVDYLVASSYKWLLGVHGLAVVYLSPELRERIVPGTLGWYSVLDIFTPTRFERYQYKPGAARLVAGMPNFPAIYALRCSLEYLLAISVERIDAGLRPLVEEVRQGFTGLGLQVLTPPGAEYASGIVSFAHPSAEIVGQELRKEGVIVWSGDGRVRASVHLYNDAEDVGCLLAKLDVVLRRVGASVE